MPIPSYVTTECPYFTHNLKHLSRSVPLLPWGHVLPGSRSKTHYSQPSNFAPFKEGFSAVPYKCAVTSSFRVGPVPMTKSGLLTIGSVSENEQIKSVSMPFQCDRTNLPTILFGLSCGVLYCGHEAFHDTKSKCACTSFMYTG